MPFAALFYPVLRACRVSVFFPASALVPISLGAVGFKLIDRLQDSGFITVVLRRPSETIETYLYLFILGYLIVFARRIRELEAEEGTRPS